MRTALLFPALWVVWAAALALLMSLVHGHLTIVISATSLMAGGALGLWSVRTVSGLLANARSHHGDRPFSTLLLGIVGVLIARHFAWILYQDSQGNLMSLPVHNNGDFPLHLTYIRSFARGAAFWPDNPVLSNSTLSYHFGIELFSALWEQLWVPTAVHLAATGMLCTLSFGYALFLLAGASLAGPALIFFSGGLEPALILLGHRSEYFDFEQELRNVFLGFILPQRGFMIGAPIGLLLILVCDHLPTLRAAQRYLIGFLFGVLPFFHAYSFLIVAAFYACWCLARPQMRRVVARTFTPAVPLLLYFSVQFSSAHGFRPWLKPGWMFAGDDLWEFVLFCLSNHGLFPVVALGSGWYSWRALSPRNRVTLLVSLGTFVVGYVVMLAPWDYDNSKLLIWSQILAVPAFAPLLRSNFFRPAWRKACLYGILCGGGFYNLMVSGFSSLNPRAYVANAAELSTICTELAPIDPQQRFATADVRNHPVALCGHPIVLGWEGHLAPQGIDTTKTRASWYALMQGSNEWRAQARRLRARYVFWGRREQSLFPTSRRPWEHDSASATLVADLSGYGRVYELLP